MAWVLHARPPVAEVICGRLVRRFDGGVFEGSWAGDPGVGGILGSTTTFGSGVLAVDDGLYLVPPSHHLESIYVYERGEQVFASNSLVGLVAAAGLTLADGVDYPEIFAQAGDGKFRFTVPTRDGFITVLLYEGLRFSSDGGRADVPKPREAPFLSYEEYRQRLEGALASVVANAAGFSLAATMSSGYDSAAMAVLARDLGCTRALTIADGKRVKSSDSLSDSGARTAAALGLRTKEFNRLGYQAREDLPEAEFLATGMTGEDVVFSPMEADLGRTVLVTGFFGDGMWWLNRPHRPLFWRLEQAGLSFTEFRLRTGFVHVPLPWFGASQMASIMDISRLPEMTPWVLGMDNDRPIPRRIIEEAGVPRGSFADAKRASSASIHADGPNAMAAASRSSLEAFAEASGTKLSFRPKRFSRWRRFAFSRARRMRARRLAEWLERPRRRVVRHQPEFGNLLLRWAMDVVKPRYADVERWRS